MLVDDHASTRREMAELIQQHAGWAVVAEAASGEACLQTIEAAAPDLVIMDILLPMMNGIEATKKLLEQRPQLPVVVLSNYDGKTLRKAVRDAGAKGYVSKDQAYERLVPAINAVLGGGVYFYDASESVAA